MSFETDDLIRFTNIICEKTFLDYINFEPFKENSKTFLLVKTTWYKIYFYIDDKNEFDGIVFRGHGVKKLNNSLPKSYLSRHKDMIFERRYDQREHVFSKQDYKAIYVSIKDVEETFDYYCNIKLTFEEFNNMINQKYYFKKQGQLKNFIEKRKIWI